MPLPAPVTIATRPFRSITHASCAALQAPPFDIDVGGI
jgi:hypothetical protein